MKALNFVSAVSAVLLSTASAGYSYDALQRPTELQYWDSTKADNGYTLYGVSGITYLLDMEGRVVHTWPIGTNPHLLSNGNVLDAATNDPSGFGGFKEVSWDGATVWSYLESRSTYHPHHDFTRIYNPKLQAYTTLYIANKDLTYAQLVAAGANPNTTPTSGAQMDAIVEVDSSGTIVWEWCFFDHLIQDYDATKSNYVGTGKTIANYPNRLNINLTGHSLKADWLHCNSLDYNQARDEIVINSVQGEFYVIDHGNTFTGGNPTASIALAATSAGDFLYRFGDPARYNQGSKPAILDDWTFSTTGNKQLGGAHDIQWIADGLTGAGHFLIFNNAEYLSEHTSQSYAMEINPFLDASGVNTGSYVNPPDAGYNTVSYAAVTNKTPKLISKQVVWNFWSKSNLTLFSQIGCSAQRLPNGNTLLCGDTEGYIMEVTPDGETVWDYIVPVTNSGIIQAIGDRLPMVNSIFRAYRYKATDPALVGRTLTPGKTIAGRTTVANPYAGASAYQALQRQTETQYWDAANAYGGYTFFAAQGTAYLINMQGGVTHTWSTGTDPRLLESGHVLDWATNSRGNTGLKELDWNGNTVWEYYETRSNYHPHGDFKRIYDPKLGAYATLYLANKDVTTAQCLGAGCDPSNAPFDGAQVDTIVEVDLSGNVVWEWSFWDHAIQSIDATKANYAGSGKTIADYPGKIDLNLPGRPLQSNWLDCNSLDFNQSLNQIVVNSRQGEFYIIDHGNTFLSGNPSGSIALAATTAGDFLYRFGDPARYSQGNPPSIGVNWETATSGNKQIGGSSNVQWIASGLPGAGHLLVFNNNQYLYQRTPQSYVFEVNPYLNSGGVDTGSYVNPPTAGYNTWTFDKDTMKANQSLSKQVVWEYGSVGCHTLFSHFGSSAQRLPNGNTLICATTTGYMLEVSASSSVVWEYINPVTDAGIVTAIGDCLPMTNAVPRATRYAASFAGFQGHTLMSGSTIAGSSYPAIMGTTRTPTAPSAAGSVWVTSTVTSGNGISSVILTYMTGSGTAATTTAFTESMCSTAVKPWTGTGAVNAWTVTGSNYFEQRIGSNYGTGNACGVEYKGGASLNPLTSAMVATTGSINATGTSGYVEFYVQALALDGSDGWTFQTDAGSGFVTRLSELSGTSHGWQKFHYDLTSGELVSTLKLRFQFTGGGTGDDDRIDLDQITVTVSSGGASTSIVTMYDDGAHGDGIAGDHVYGGEIPLLPQGTAVSYYLTATDAAGLTITDPLTAPVSPFSYVVLSASAVPVAAFSASPTSGGAPLTVVFTDTSTGNITNRHWEFGDGMSLDTTATSVQHTYAVPNTFTVSLTASGLSGTSTTIQTGLITATSVDSVGDGIADWWRAKYFGGDGKTTTSNTIATADPDHDGVDNYHEYLADTVPTNALSWFHILSFSKSNGFSVYFQSSINRKYTLYFTSDLRSGIWTPISTQIGIVGSGGVDSLTDPSPSGTQRFYRVEVQFLWQSDVQQYSMMALPDTGQAARYSTIYGEDSVFTINPPTYKANGDGTVTDKVTGLMWQQVDGGEMTWEQAVTYASTLSLGGHSDWRLPFAKELFSILNQGVINPAIDTAYFPASVAEYWWSSETAVDDITKVWITNAGGGIGPHWKTETISAGGSKRIHVRCVRDPLATGVKRFTGSLTDNGNGTVTDNHTGLVWQQAETVTMTWEQALAYAQSLSLGGRSDWRLPNIKELQSVSDNNFRAPALNKTYFPGATTTHYWSSTSLANDSTQAWYLDCDYGLTTYQLKTGSWHVRCVRGGTAASISVPALKPIPQGTFVMGDHFAFVDPGHGSDEIPLHTVSISAFCLGTYDITNKQYCDYLNSALTQGLIEVRNGLVYAVGGTSIYCETRSSTLYGVTYSGIVWSGSSFSVLDGRSSHPMVGVRWEGAAAYCNWLSALQGYESCYNLTTWICDFAKKGYRLPTEAEWEYAANGGYTNPYYQFPWGSNTNTDGSWSNWQSSGDPYETGDYPWTTPVGFYDGSLHLKSDFNWPGSQITYQSSNAVNGYGLFDMGGNVWQWVNDWYSASYYSVSSSSNPTGPAIGDPMPDGNAYRVLRGGNWYNGAEYYGHSRISNRDPAYYRGPQDPNHPYYHVGFRVALKTASLVQPGASITTLAGSLLFAEGPAADSSGNVYFSDIKANTIYKWSSVGQLSIFGTNSGGANGLAVDSSGSLITCEGSNGRIVSISPQGIVTVLASQFNGKRFNEPNDLWIDPKGGIYFTDPVFFGTQVQDGQDVYYISPDRSTVTRVISDMVQPNGIVGTADGTTLYVSDYGAGATYKYTINTDGTLTGKTLFVSVGSDGMEIDSDGNIYLTSDDVLVYNSAGTIIQTISVLNRPTNLCFSGSDRRTLIITTENALYSIAVRTQGLPVTLANAAPTIAGVSTSPLAPSSTDSVWITGQITDDVSISAATLYYSTGSGTAATTTAFTESMCSTAVKPWTGTGAVNAWTVTGSNYFEQRIGSNYGTGNACGVEYKGGASLNPLTSAMVATTGSINATGTSGYVEFYVQALALDGSDGWTFQTDAGSGFVTRLSELSGTSHGWQKFHYDLTSGELVSTLKLRFQFTGGGTGDDDRIDLDQITVTVSSGGASTSTVTMYDDGAHGDGVAGDHVYGAQIPAMAVGTTVRYYLTATDDAGLSSSSPTGASSNTYSYVVQPINTPPVISVIASTSGSANAMDAVWVTGQVTDNGSVAGVTLTYNAGSGPVSVTMLDDGLHHDGIAGDSIYGCGIPAFPAGTSVSYYLTATDNLGVATTGTTTTYTVEKSSSGQTAGLYFNTASAYDGYTLMAPMHYTLTYLIDNAGEVVHRWSSAYEPGRAAYLLENGHMIRACMIMSGGISTGGGEGGRIEEYDWDGNMVWAFDYYSSTHMAHHDFKVLPNGNVLILAVEKKSYAEVIAAGFNPSLLDSSISTQGYMLPDYLIEVTPTKPYGGTIVWEWHLWDHMIQDYDASKANYGVVSDHPERINVNGTGIKIPQFWTHVNGIDYNSDLDQVMLSIRNNSELFIIDHQITAAQAASHTGGRYSKGGDILYRWGNPLQYKRGTSANQLLYQQHHTHWIPAGYPGAGDILIFNNGIGRGYSTINEITPPVDSAGNYTLASGSAYGPSACSWTYQSSPATDFYSAEISGCQRLPNGNTLVCEGVKGNLFEVTTAGQMVWRYVCPVTDSGPLTQGDVIPGDGVRADQYMNAVFRVYRYAPDYAGLLGRDLTAQGTVELPVNKTLRVVAMSKADASQLNSISWVSLPELDYAVQFSPSLLPNTWTTIATVHSIGALTKFTDTDATRRSLSRGFYRVALP